MKKKRETIFLFFFNISNRYFLKQKNQFFGPTFGSSSSRGPRWWAKNRQL